MLQLFQPYRPPLFEVFGVGIWPEQAVIIAVGLAVIAPPVYRALS